MYRPFIKNPHPDSGEVGFRVYSLFQIVQAVRRGEVWRGETDIPVWCTPHQMGRLPPCKWLSFLFPLTLSVKLQRLDNRILNFLRRRPRCKILADTLPRNLELLLLVGLFLLHNGENHIHIKPPFL